MYNQCNLILLETEFNLPFPPDSFTEPFISLCVFSGNGLTLSGGFCKSSLIPESSGTRSRGVLPLFGLEKNYWKNLLVSSTCS